MKIVRWPLLLPFLVVMSSVVGFAGTRGPTYRKADESVTMAEFEQAAKGGNCAEEINLADPLAVAEALDRAQVKKEDIGKYFKEMNIAHSERLQHIDYLARLIRQWKGEAQNMAEEMASEEQLRKIWSGIADMEEKWEKLQDFDDDQERLKEKLNRRFFSCIVWIENLRENGAKIIGKSRFDAPRGQVDIQRAGESDWSSVPKEGLDIHPGDIVRTGPDGYVTWTLEDGSYYRVYPDSVWRDSNSGPILDKGNIILDIKESIFKYFKRFEVRTPTAVIAERGTEYTVEVGASGPTRLGAIDKVMVMTALEAPPGRPPFEPPLRRTAESLGNGTLPSDALAALGSSAADTRIKRKGGSWQPAAPGEALREGDVIKAGPQARVPVRLGGGFSAALAPGSVLQVQRDPKGRALYGLWTGSLYALRSAPAENAERDPVFTSPSAVCAVRGTEFEYAVKAGQPPEFIVYRGTVEVTADGKRLKDPALFKAWWEE